MEPGPRGADRWKAVKLEARQFQAALPATAGADSGVIRYMSFLAERL